MNCIWSAGGLTKLNSARKLQIYYTKFMAREAKIMVVFDTDIAPENSGKYLLFIALFDVEIEKFLDLNSKKDEKMTVLKPVYLMAGGRGGNLVRLL